MQIEATYDLIIELAPGETADESALVLISAGGEDEQSIVIMLDEVEPLRQALAEAAEKLKTMSGG